MSEKLIIRNFGPIKDMSFDFKKINILIGEQGTGKSTVAKVITAINSMADGDPGNLGAIKILTSGEYGTRNHFVAHLKVYLIEGYLQNDTHIHYENDKFYFEYEVNRASIKAKNAEAVLYEAGVNEVTFIPADRAAVNLFSNEVLLSFNELEADLPSYFIRFARLYNRFKKLKPEFDFSDLIGVKFKYKNDRDIIVLHDGEEINIKEASSALQTNISLLIILSYFEKFTDRLENMNTESNLVIIEEPELNCFPALQKKTIQYIINCLYIRNGDFFSRTLITTHSPYILTSLNNLMYAYQAGLNYESEINKIVDKKYWVNPFDVSAYLMLPNGECESILDREGLIKTEKIDGISGILNKEFNEMFDIELAIKK